MSGNFNENWTSRRGESNLVKFSNVTSTINPKLYERHRMIICLLLHDKNYTPQHKTFEALYPDLLEDNSQCQHHILCLN